MKIKSSVLALLVSIAYTLLGTGCASMYSGTGRQIHLKSNVPNAVGSINGSREERLPHSWKLNTRRDSKEPISFRVATSDGRKIEGKVDWVTSKDGKTALIAGGVGWGVVTGIGGLGSLGIDYWTKAYRDLESDTIIAEFGPHYPAPTAINPHYHPVSPQPLPQQQFAPNRPPQFQQQFQQPRFFQPKPAGSGT